MDGDPNEPNEVEENQGTCNNPRCTRVLKNLHLYMKNTKINTDQLRNLSAVQAEAATLRYKLVSIESELRSTMERAESAINAKELAEAELKQIQSSYEVNQRKILMLQEKADEAEMHKEQTNVWRQKFDSMGCLAEKLEENNINIKTKYETLGKTLEMVVKKSLKLQSQVTEYEMNKGSESHKQKKVQKYLKSAIQLIDSLSSSTNASSHSKQTQDLIDLFRRDDVRLYFNSSPWNTPEDQEPTTSAEVLNESNEHLSDSEDDEEAQKLEELLLDELKTSGKSEKKPRSRPDFTEKLIKLRAERRPPQRIVSTRYAAHPPGVRKPGENAQNLGIFDPRKVHSRVFPTSDFETIAKATENRKKALLGEGSGAGSSGAGTTIHGKKGKTVREMQTEMMKGESVKEKVARMKREAEMAKNPISSENLEIPSSQQLEKPANSEIPSLEKPISQEILDKPPSNRAPGGSDLLEKRTKEDDVPGPSNIDYSMDFDSNTGISQGNTPIPVVSPVKQRRGRPRKMQNSEKSDENMEKIPKTPTPRRPRAHNLSEASENPEESESIGRRVRERSVSRASRKSDLSTPNRSSRKRNLSEASEASDEQDYTGKRPRSRSVSRSSQKSNKSNLRPQRSHKLSEASESSEDEYEPIGSRIRSRSVSKTSTSTAPISRRNLSEKTPTKTPVLRSSRSSKLSEESEDMAETGRSLRSRSVSRASEWSEKSEISTRRSHRIASKPTTPLKNLKKNPKAQPPKAPDDVTIPTSSPSKNSREEPEEEEEELTIYAPETLKISQKIEEKDAKKLEKTGDFLKRELRNRKAAPAPPALFEIPTRTRGMERMKAPIVRKSKSDEVQKPPFVERNASQKLESVQQEPVSPEKPLNLEILEIPSTEQPEKPPTAEILEISSLEQQEKPPNAEILEIPSSEQPEKPTNAEILDFSSLDRATGGSDHLEKKTKEADVPGPSNIDYSADFDTTMEIPLEIAENSAVPHGNPQFSPVYESPEVSPVKSPPKIVSNLKIPPLKSPKQLAASQYGLEISDSEEEEEPEMTIDEDLMVSTSKEEKKVEKNTENREESTNLEALPISEPMETMENVKKPEIQSVEEAPPISQEAPPISREAPPTSFEAPPISQKAPPTSSKAPPPILETPPISQATSSKAPPTLKSSQETAPVTSKQKAPPTSSEAPPTLKSSQETAPVKAPPISSKAPPTSFEAPPPTLETPPTSTEAPPTLKSSQETAPKQKAPPTKIPETTFKQRSRAPPTLSEPKKASSSSSFAPKNDDFINDILGGVQLSKKPAPMAQKRKTPPTLKVEKAEKSAEKADKLEKLEKKQENSSGKVEVPGTSKSSEPVEKIDEPEPKPAEIPGNSFKNPIKRTILIDAPVFKKRKLAQKPVGLKQITAENAERGGKRVGKLKTHFRQALDLKVSVDELKKRMEEKGFVLGDSFDLTPSEAVDVMMEFLRQSSSGDMWAVLVRQRMEGSLQPLVNKEEENFLQVSASFNAQHEKLLEIFISRVLSEFANRDTINSAQCGRLTRLFCHAVRFFECSGSSDDDVITTKKSTWMRRLIDMIFLKNPRNLVKSLAYCLISDAGEYCRWIVEEMEMDGFNVPFRILLHSDDEQSKIINWLLNSRFQMAYVAPPTSQEIAQKFHVAHDKYVASDDEGPMKMTILMAKSGSNDCLQVAFDKLKMEMKLVETQFIEPQKNEKELKHRTVYSAPLVATKMTEKEAETLKKQWKWQKTVLQVMADNSSVKHWEQIMNALRSISPQIVALREIVGSSEIDQFAESPAIPALGEAVEHISQLISKFTHYALKPSAL